jgi:tRNA dimethylallyltransferase
MNSKLPLVFVVAGPTASGKTSCAIKLAEKFQCPILSADSRQVYKEMNIGVARPDEKELQRATHYFIADRSITEPFNAGIFEKEALKLLQELFIKHQVVIVCGGTGLFIKALTQGLDNLPDSSQTLRDDLNEGFKKGGLDFLKAKLMETDPDFAPLAETQNPERLMRAIEIAVLSGKSNLELRKGAQTHRFFRTAGIVLDLPRETLYERINQRVDQMIEQGLEEEVKGLLPYKDLPQMRTVGYKEWFDYFDGKEDKEQVIEKIKQHTRNFAKRQLTWFRHQSNFKWVQADEALNELELALNMKD